MATKKQVQSESPVQPSEPKLVQEFPAAEPSEVKLQSVTFTDVIRYDVMDRGAYKKALDTRADTWFELVLVDLYGMKCVCVRNKRHLTKVYVPASFCTSLVLE